MVLEIFMLESRHDRHDRPKNHLKALIYIALNRAYRGGF
ncbi:hypothetical protein F7308_0904 [Francisella salina]|uniref:Transposase n=1 Tax=Francisella salina TaxID=573569 RepID=A0ABN3ZL33_FRAST|nr:hypothetical protein F7308_0904 [Francisella salina]